jgi:cardiolipin synthase
VAVTEPPITPAAPESRSREDRIWTIPNIISIIRLCCLPIFLYLLFGKENRAAAAGLLAVLGVTDFVDGYIARHFDQISNLGKILDPVADRLLFFVGVTGIMIDGSCPAWFGWMVLIREAAVAIVTVAIGLMGAKRADVTWFGKAGTFFLMFAFPLFLASNSTLGWAPLAEVLAWATGIPGLVLSYIAWAMYVPIGMAALREGRAARAAKAAQAGPTEASIDVS